MSPSNPPPRTIADPPGELLAPREVARIFGVDVRTVTAWANSGKLRALRTLGGHRRFRRADVERLLGAP